MRSTRVMGMVLLFAYLTACGRGKVDEVEVTTGALVINQANVFGFEDRTQWQSSVALSSSTTHTQGSVSLGVAAKGYTEVTSVALSALAPLGVSGTLGIDVRLPTAQPNPFWLGAVQMYVSIPSKGVYNAYLGQQELTGKPLNQFFELDYTLAPGLVTTLQAGGYTDLKMKVVVNVPTNATGTVLLDNLRFIGGQGGGQPGDCLDFVESNILGVWSWGASDAPTATTTLSVLGPTDAVRGQSALRAVTTSGFDFWLRYQPAAAINASGSNELRVAVRGRNTTPIGWQINAPVIVAEDSTGARIQFAPNSQLLSADGLTWAAVTVPLAGSANWTTTGGPVNWGAIRAVEIHADTWDSGFTLDVDALSFARTGAVCECPVACGTHGTCNQTTLACECNLGYSGPGCTACTTGFVSLNGACVLTNDGVSSVWPNQFSKAASDPWLAVHHDEIQTVKPNVLVVGFVNVSTPERDTALINQIFAAYREASRMQGFKNPTQPSQLQYQLAKFVDLRDGVNGRPPPPAGYPFQNSTLFPFIGSQRPGSSVDYSAFYSQSFANLYGYPDPAQPGRFLTLCELVNQGTVHELWMVGSGDVPDAGAAEVLETKQRYTPQGNKIAGSSDPCAGNGCFAPNIPFCGRSLRIGFVNYSRGPGCYIESLGHGMESSLGGAEAPFTSHTDIFAPMTSWFVPFAGLNLNVKYGLPINNFYQVSCANPEECMNYPTLTSIRIDFGGTILNVNPWDAVCGNVHVAPNAHHQYDLCGGATNPDLTCNLPLSSAVSTSCTGYGRHAGPGGTDLKETITSSNWMPAYGALAQDCQGAFLVWWHQNMPMFGSGQTFANGQRMKSVWPYLYY